MSRVKRPKKDFELFKKEFVKWQRKLNLMEFRVDFYMCDLEEGVAADITIYHRDSVAMVRLNAFRCSGECGHPRAHAKHEAIHLLVGKIVWLGLCRFVQEEEIRDEEHRVVRILEKVL